MAELVADCPRCGAQKITFDLEGDNWYRDEHGWKNWYETFCICRRCHYGSVLFLSQKLDAHDVRVREVGLANLPGSLNDYFKVEGYLSLKDELAEPPPEHLPPAIDAAFREGATCLAVKCYNAAGTMFRLCLDFATREKLPSPDVRIDKRIRFSLGHRLQWLFDEKLLPEELRDLSSVVKDDGNDGAHEGTLTEVDAEDLHEFAFVLLERLYTEPKRLEIAKERRQARHKKAG
jgi:hypothetical protein